MKYNLAKCNNLRWKYKEDEGFIKTCGEDVALLSDEKTLNEHGETVHRVFKIGNAKHLIADLADPKEFRIVPRNTQKYKDWQLGDRCYMYKNGECADIVEVSARINDVVIVSNTDGYYGTYTCDELFRTADLILTDYENEVDAKSPAPFKAGDKVLVRDEGTEWTYGIFSEYHNDWTAKFIIAECSCPFDECIPYNEETWHLLGTTDDYVENADSQTK